MNFFQRLRERIEKYDDGHNFTCDVCGREVFENERVCAQCKRELPWNNGHVLHMGVQGAALATVIAQACSAVWVLLFLTGRKAVLRLDRESLGLDGPILRRVCGLGLTGFTFSITNSLVQALGNAQLQAYGGASGGDLYVAAMTAIVSVREIVFQPIRGLTQGAQPVIGYNYGAGRYSRVRESVRFLTAACLGYNVLVWALLLAFPRAFILLFNDDPGLLAVGAPQAGSR